MQYSTMAHKLRKAKLGIITARKSDNYINHATRVNK